MAAQTPNPSTKKDPGETVTKFIKGARKAGKIQKNQEIVNLIKELKSAIGKLPQKPTDPGQFQKYVSITNETLNPLISQAHVLIQSDIETGVFNKDALLGKDHPITRAYWAIELLAAMLKKIKDENDDKEKDDDQSIAQQTSNTPSTPLPPLNWPQNTQPGTPPGKQPVTGQIVPLSQSYTGQTIQLKSSPGEPVTGSTQPLIQSGTASLAATGATIPLTLSAIPLVGVKTLQDYQMHISKTTDAVLSQIAKGTYGSQLQKEIQDDLGAVRKQVYQHVNQKTWDLAAFTDYDLLKKNRDVPEIANALQRRSALEDQLYKEGLLDEHLLGNKLTSSFRNYFEANIVDKAWEGVSPLETLPNDRFVNVNGPHSQAQLLSNFQELYPRIAADYPKLFNTAKEKLAKEGVKKVGEKVASEGVKKAAGTVASKGIGTAATGALTAALSFLGPLAPIAAKALTWLGGKLLVPLYKFIRRRSEDIAKIGTGILALGALTGSALLAGAGAGLIGISLAGGGPSLMLGSIGAGVGAFFGILGSLLVGAVVVPIVVSFIGVILFIGFALLIINNSGYVTPYSPKLLTDISTPGESLNLQVTKTASRSELPNSSSPQDVTYTITIKALENDLTNISFNNSYQITQEPLKASPPETKLPAPPSSIKKGNTYTFTYIVSYTEVFKDSYVCDTFEVTATAGSTSDRSSATACITIGTSSVVAGCPSGWPMVPGSGRSYKITQGFNTYPLGSHGLTGPEEAVDIAIGNTSAPRPPRQDDYIVATHDGIIKLISKSPEFGNRIEIVGTCNGKQFISYYGHLRDDGLGQGLRLGQKVTKGTRIALIGNTGVIGIGYHVHYAFYPYGGPVRIGMPFLPVNREQIRGCIGFEACGSIVIQ